MIERKSWLEKFVVICDKQLRPLRKTNSQFIFVDSERNI